MNYYKEEDTELINHIKKLDDLVKNKNLKHSTANKVIESFKFITDNFDVKNNKYFFQSCLILACQFNKVDLCDYILKNYAHSVNVEGQPFKAALENNSSDVLTYLICDYKINQSDQVMLHLERSKLHMLYEAQKRNIVQYNDLMILFAKRDVNQRLEDNLIVQDNSSNNKPKI